jgi:hypothetical protein
METEKKQIFIFIILPLIIITSITIIIMSLPTPRFGTDYQDYEVMEDTWYDNIYRDNSTTELGIWSQEFYTGTRCFLNVRKKENGTFGSGTACEIMWGYSSEPTDGTMSLDNPVNISNITSDSFWFNFVGKENGYKDEDMIQMGFRSESKTFYRWTITK